MDTQPVTASPVRARVMGIAAAAWVCVVAASLAVNWYYTGTSMQDLAVSEARFSYQKDLVYRRWASLQGGVYVPPTEATPPNSYLAHLPDRDVTTTDGKRLTLVNPAYMTRQVQELGREQYGLRAHLTSLRPIRPGNSADAWETQCLQAFEKGRQEVISLEMLDGRPFLRMMRPFVTEASCLKCHAAQGYSVGDLRGGLSVSVPMAPYLAALRQQRLVLVLVHVLIGGLGLAGLWAGNRALRTSEKAVQRSEEKQVVLCDNLSAGVMMVDRDLRIMSINTALRRMFPDCDFADAPYCYEVCNIPSQCAPCSDCPARQAFEKGGTHAAEREITTSRGVRTISMTATALAGVDGKISTVIEVIEDITERRQAEANLARAAHEQAILIENLQLHQTELALQNEELRSAQVDIEASRVRYFELYDLAPIGYCTLSEKNIILEANLCASALLGVDRSALIKKPITRFLFSEDQDIFYRHCKDLFATEETQQCELRILKPDGTIVWVHMVSSMASDSDGAPCSHVVFADVTERKHAEEEKVESMHELQRLFNATLNREDRVLELKGEINTLLERLGEPHKFFDGPKQD